MELQANNMKNSLISKIREQFEETHRNCKAVIPISSDKVSRLHAALCTEALGKERLIGVLTPNGSQRDMPDNYQLMEQLGIPGMIINISGAVESIHNQLEESGIHPTASMDQQLLPGIRMAVLDAVAQATNGKTVHFQEQLSSRTVTELAHTLGLPETLI